MLVDANILVYAVDSTSRFHEWARSWLEDALNGDRRVGLPWSSIVAFLRITTHPRAMNRPLSTSAAWRFAEEWLDAGTAWIPVPTDRHASILGDLLVRHELPGNLVPDADLAALAIEHGLEVISNDSDFARFPEIRWANPLAGSAPGGVST